MASIFGHFAAGYTISKLVNWKTPLSIVILALVSSFLPDIDVIAFKFGIPYEHWAGHRGFTHSVLFALIWGAICSQFFKKQRILVFVIISLATLSHSVLDGMTTGGLGCAFFFPFDNERYFLPWRVIKVSPIGASKFLSEWGLKVIISELFWVILPASVLLISKRIITNKNNA